MIQAETGGTLFEIEPATPYTDDYNQLLDIAQQEQADNARPELANSVENQDGYPAYYNDEKVYEQRDKWLADFISQVPPVKQDDIRQLIQENTEII